MTVWYNSNVQRSGMNSNWGKNDGLRVVPCVIYVYVNTNPIETHRQSNKRWQKDKYYAELRCCSFQRMTDDKPVTFCLWIHPWASKKIYWAFDLFMLKFVQTSQTRKWHEKGILNLKKVHTYVKMNTTTVPTVVGIDVLLRQKET